jgi:hypothetical protein
VEGSDLRDRFGPARTEPGPDGVGRTWVFQVPEKPLTTRYLYRFEATLGKEPGAPRAILAREDGSPMMVKFKGPVPAGIVVFHVLGMFGGFFLLMLSLFHSVNLASGRGSPEKAARTAWGAWILMFIGGVPLGFAMNYYAFGVMWEAFPFGKDVTDNKTQIALILWGLAALILSRKGGRKAGLVGITAGLAVLAVFLIPHSL